MAIQEMGYPAISLTAWQYGLTSDSNYSNARIKSINDERLAKELDSHKIIICAGFQGINKYDDITTLGRGGSDTTAVAIAAALKADLCQIYTDVDGVYTADPRKVKNAKKLDEITYDEMLELATLGAQVLCNRSVELAKKYGVKLEVCSSYEQKPGTKVKEEVKTLEKMLITGVAKDSDISRISVLGLKDIPGEAFKLFTLLGQNKVNVDIILQSIGRDGTKDISFTVSKSNMRATVDLLREKYPENKVIHEENITKVSIVGAGMQSNAGVAAKLFEALYNVGVNIQMISTSEIKISVLIDSKDEAAAVESIHDAFMA
jgi:aspartate kinase